MKAKEKIKEVEMAYTPKAPAFPVRPFSLKADETASFFGFNSMDSFLPGRQDREYARELADGNTQAVPFLDEDVAFVKKYLAESWFDRPHPLLLSSHNSMDKKKTSVSLRLVGIAGSAAEALAIRTSLSLLEEAGHKNLMVALGSIGDRESMNDFDRAVASFLRKNTPLMLPEMRKLMRENPLALLTDKKYVGSPFAERFPTPIASLSPTARNLLKEVIEYVEAMDVPYFLDTALVGPRSISHHIVFEIRDAESGEVFSRGLRLSPLIKRMGGKRETAFLSVTVAAGATKAVRKLAPVPKFHFVQLGYSAKLLSLSLVERLRKEGVAVLFHISRDKLLSQLGPEDKTPFLIIMGHKEALDKTVVIRDNETRAQIIVPLADAPAFIKKVLKRGRV